MRKGLVISSFLLLAALSFGAQGHGRGKVAVNPGTRHSNAPSGTPAASSDRDQGKPRRRCRQRQKERLEQTRIEAQTSEDLNPTPSARPLNLHGRKTVNSSVERNRRGALRRRRAPSQTLGMACPRSRSSRCSLAPPFEEFQSRAACHLATGLASRISDIEWELQA